MYQVPIIMTAESRDPCPLALLHADFATAHVVVGDGGEPLGGSVHGEQGAGLGNHKGYDYGLVGVGVFAGGVAAVEGRGVENNNLWALDRGACE